MRFSTIVGALLCAEAVVAAPFTALRRERHEKRAARRSRPRMPANSTHAQFSENWSGGVLVTTGVRSVTASIVVPTPRTPSGGSTRTEFAASAWVGIDGDTCQTAILQTGVDFFVEGTATAFDAWFEYFPAAATNFNGITVAAGNTIKMTATASSTNSGTATIENVSTGVTVTHTFTGQSARLCQTNAEWIVEDFEEGSSLVPFADFGTVSFTGASAVTSAGTVGVTGATILDIEQGTTVLTNCAVSGSSTVTCSYV